MERLHPQAASWLNSGNFCDAYVLDDRSAMNLTLTFTSAALLGGLLGALANYAPSLPQPRPVGTTNGTITPQPLAEHPRGGSGAHYDDEENIEEASHEHYEHVGGYHDQLAKQTSHEHYHANKASQRQGDAVRERRSHVAPQEQRVQSRAAAQNVPPMSSTRTRPNPTSRTSRGSTTATRSSPTTSAQQGDTTRVDNGAGLVDEISWMAVSNNNPPTRGATRLGPPTTTTTSVPPPPPPMFQEENTPMPPPLHPDMLLNMGYPQGTTWVLEEGVWQPIFPGEAQGALGATPHADPPQQYHSRWSIFAEEDSGNTGSASSQGAQHPIGSSPGAAGHQHNHQQPHQPRHLPREAVNRGAAPAATNQWHSGWSPAHHNHAQHPQPQHMQQMAQGRGTWGYAATAAPSNGPWRPRYAPVYDPHTDPWHEDEEDDPLPAVAQSYSQTATQGGTDTATRGTGIHPTPAGASTTLANTVAGGASAGRTQPGAASGRVASAAGRYDPDPGNSPNLAAAAAAGAHSGVGYLSSQPAQRNTSTASQSGGYERRTAPSHTGGAGGLSAATPTATAAEAAKTHPGGAGEDQRTQTQESTRTSRNARPEVGACFSRPPGTRKRRTTATRSSPTRPWRRQPGST